MLQLRRIVSVLNRLEDYKNEFLLLFSYGAYIKTLGGLY